MMAVSVLSAARRICEQSDWTFTNLQLQKILYLAHMMHMGEHNGQQLINGSFEAWDYGPVQPNVYRCVSLFGRRPIQDVFGAVADISGTSEADTIDQCVAALRNKTASELVSITHWENGAWARHYTPELRGSVIDDADILEEYRARANAT